MAESDTILQLGIEAAREGNREEARNLFGLLTRQEPDNVQAWLWLAGVAEGPDERRAALERVIELEPTNEMASKGLQAMGATPIAPTPRAPAPVPAAPARDLTDEERYAAELDSAFDDYDALPKAAPPPRPDPDLTGDDTLGFDSPRSSSTARSRRTSRLADDDDDEMVAAGGGSNRLLWGLLALIFVAVLAFLFFRVLGGRGDQQVAGGGTPGSNAALTATSNLTPTLEIGGGPTGTLTNTGALSGTTSLTPTETLSGTAPLTPTQGTPPTSPPGDLAAANPAPVAVGAELQANGWTYSFPGICGVSCGTVQGPQIGSFSTQGSYVVVLALVANNTGKDQPLPADFFVLKDAQGRIYQPLPQVSSAYVQRGVNADVGMEDAVPANGIFTSVPLVFDVQHGATNLTLFARAKTDQGWPVLNSVP